MKSEEKADIITGPTLGIRYETAVELPKHSTVILVGKNPEKLEQVKKTIIDKGPKALSIVRDISDLKSIARAAEQIIKLQLPISVKLFILPSEDIFRGSRK